jgi:hypothetical protein
MKAGKLRQIAFVAGLMVAGSTVHAAPPTITQQVTPGTISYQGRIQEAGGADYTNGIYDIEFRLYDAATGGNQLWGATYKPYLKNGYFSAILGQINVGETSLTGSTFSVVSDLWKAVWVEPGATTDRYLGIKVAARDGTPIVGAQESFPRQQLLASPFAIQAQFAQQAKYAESTSGDFTIPTANKLNFAGGNGTIESGGTQINVNDDLNVTGSVTAPRVITAYLHNNGANVNVGWDGIPEDLLVWGNHVIAKNTCLVMGMPGLLVIYSLVEMRL